MTKQQLDAEWHESIETALDMEAEVQAELMKTNDFRRAYDAFANKRVPEFRVMILASPPLQGRGDSAKLSGGGGYPPSTLPTPRSPMASRPLA